MKIALYIEEGLEQIVLTPESKTEEGILGKLHDGSRELSVHHNSFFRTVGGFVRQGEDRRSTMIVLREPRDRDGAEGGDAKAAPVPQDRHARPEGIAQ